MLRGRSDSACERARSGSLVATGTEQGVDKRRGFEFAEVLGLLADADEPNWELEPLAHRNHRTTLGGAVEFRYDQPCDAQGLVELLGLDDAVLTETRIEHQQDLVRSAGVEALDNRFHLRALIH